MTKVIFPKLDDYPAGLLQPQESLGYAKIVESSGIAYFYGNPAARILFRRRLKKAARLLGGQKFEAVFDAGTGIGFFLPHLASIAARVEAIDYHQESLETARAMLLARDLGNVNLMHGDILKLPYADASFDAVVCMSALEHIQSLHEAFLEMKRVLKPGGKLVVGYPMEDWLMKFFLILDRLTFFRKYQPVFSESVHSGEVVGHISNWKGIDEELAKQFRVIKKDYISVIPIFGRIYALRLAVK